MYLLVKPTQDGPQTSVAGSASTTADGSDSAASLPHVESSESGTKTGGTATTDDENENEDETSSVDSDFDTDDDDSNSIFRGIIRSYMSNRNLTAANVSDPDRTSKDIIENLNSKFVQNNYRTIGLNKISDEFDIERAFTEFVVFDKWFVHMKKCATDKKYITDLRLPMFCHLYLSLYSKQNRKLMLEFLYCFINLFCGSNRKILWQELKSITDTNSLPPRLSLFRKNKFVCSVPAEFLTSLLNFFQQNFILKVVFQEWFDVNYIMNDDPKRVFDDYYKNNVSKINTQFKAKADTSIQNISELNNVSTVTNNQSSINKLISSQNMDKSRNLTDPENNVSNDKAKQKKFQTKYNLNFRRKSSGIARSRHNESSSESTSDGSSSSNDSFIDEQAELRKYFRNHKHSGENESNKNPCRLKFLYTSKIDLKTLDEDSRLCTARQITLTNCRKLTCAIITSDHKYVAAGSLDSFIYLWERSNVPTELEIKNLRNNIDFTFGSNTDSLYSEKSKHFIELLDKSAAKILRGHGGPIFDLAEIPSANILISVSSDKTFRAWDLKSKLCLEVYNESEHRSWCIASCPYTLQIASGSCDGTSCLWFLNYKRPLRIFTGHLDDVLVLKFHPNQIVLATGSADKTIRIFELVTGECKRLLLGHSDYITCLEFHPEKCNVLASASGSGEIMVWDVPSANILWKLKVGNMLFSDLVWLADDVLLASLTSGIVLKCDIIVDYGNSGQKVKGFTTSFNRLISLKIIDTIVYTIGIQGKITVPKLSSIKRKTKASQRVENEPQQTHTNHREQKTQKESSPMSKLLVPQQKNDNNGNSVRPLRGLSSTSVNSPTSDLQLQLNINPKITTQVSSDLLQINLQRTPSHLNNDELNCNKLNSDYQSKSIRLIQKPSVTNLQNTSVSTQITNTNSSERNIQATNVQCLHQSKQNFHLTSTNIPQQLTYVLDPLQSQTTPNMQHYQLGNNQFTMDMDVQHFQLQNSQDPMLQSATIDIQDHLQLQLQDCKEINQANNEFIQQQHLGSNINKSVKCIQQQQPQMIRPRILTQSLNKSVIHQDNQQLQLQHRMSNNFQMASTNIMQETPFQNLQPKTLINQANVQQQQPQQNIFLSNTNPNFLISSNEIISLAHSQPSNFNTLDNSKPGPSFSTPFIRHQNPTMTISEPYFEELPEEEFGHISDAFVESLLQTTPEMSMGDQTVFSEITKSQSVTQSPNNIEPNSEAEI